MAPGPSSAQDPQPWSEDIERHEGLARRNPRLLLRFPGEFLLRFATRAFAGVLFQDPPRLTRFEPSRGATPSPG